MSIVKGMTANSQGNAIIAYAFCTLPLARVINESAIAVVVRDDYPVSPSHTRRIPRGHVRPFFDLSAQERSDILSLLT